MAYSELIKNFDRIRDYMRQFYVYGFKSRNEYDKKSARSYDNERRRTESWLGDFMSFRQTADGKNVFLSVDSRSIPRNPLYNAFKAKSFTSGDVTFHFYVLDLLQDDSAYNAQEIVDLFSEKYLRHFDTNWEPDISTVRKKLKEYVSLGLLKSEKRGRELVFSRNNSSIELSAWADTLAFFAEADPLGVVGSFLLDKLETVPDYFQFKHHYILHTLDSQLLLQLLTAIGEHRRIKLTNASVRSAAGKVVHTVHPLKIFVSTQGGRQYLLCYHFRFRKLMFFRMDYIHAVELLDLEPDHERYGTYFDVLSEILEKAVDGELTRDTMYAIIQEKGFEESILTIPQNLNDQTWPLLSADLTTPLEHEPTQPITTLQKRWMKALLNDPRIRLFAPPVDGLEDVEPLYPTDTFVYFDRYGDGDPFEDPQYIQRFQTILTALRERKWLRLHFLGRNNVPHSWRCIPYKLEYSPKDDKFRLITSNNRAPLIINLARITDCKLLEPVTNEEYRPKAMRKRKLVLELTDNRNALERCMLHFSHLEKETERIDDRHYRLTLHYEKDDETELLIRVLSFGHVLKVVSPDQFKEKLKKRIEKQMQLRTRK